MDTNILAPKVAAATLASAHAGNRDLSTDPKRMGVIKVWESAGSAEREFNGAKLRHMLETSSMLGRLIRQGMKTEEFGWYLGSYAEYDVKRHSGAGVGMAHVAQSILGQTGIRECVPFLINRDNVN